MIENKLNNLGLAIKEALEELLDYYEKGELGMDYCPLCQAVFYDSCCCPWYTIEKIGCEQFHSNNISYNPILKNCIEKDRYDNKKEWRELRIPMLKNWIEILSDKERCPGIYMK